MADVYKGLTVKFGADTTGLSSALRGIDKQSRGLGTELRKVDRALKFNPGNSELIRQKQQALAKQIDTTKTRLDALREAESKLGKEDVGTDAYNNLKREIIETESKLKGLEKASKDANNRMKDPKVQQALANLKTKATAAVKAIARVATGMAIAAVGAGVKLSLMAEKSATADARVANIAQSMGLFGDQTDEVTAALLRNAEAQARQTGVDTNSIKATQAKLLTFKELAASAGEVGGAFDRAQAAAIDMAAAGFGEAEGNAVQLGKALQDPIKGITALAKSGVTFTDAEKDMIAAMVETGDMAGAQNMILKAVETQVGGTAEATANASDKMKVGLTQMAEKVGKMLLPTFEKITGWVTDTLVPAFDGFLAMLQNGEAPLDAFSITMAESFGIDVSGLTNGIKAVSDTLSGVFTFVSENKDWLLPIVVAIAAVAGAITVAVQAYKAWQAITLAVTVVQAILNTVMSANPIGIIILAIVALVAALVYLWKNNETFREVVTKVWEAVKGAVLAVVDWFKTAPPAAFQAVKDKASSIFNSLKEFFVQWGPLILVALAPFIGLPLLIRDNWGKIVDTTKEIFGKVRDFIKEQIDKVRGFFKFEWEWPKIKTPHFSVSNWSLNPADWVANGMPKINVEWYASGGSFAPGALSLIGVGDQQSGYEHVLRDDQIVSLMRRALESNRGEQHLHFHAQNQSYSETKRSVRDALEAVAL